MKPMLSYTSMSPNMCSASPNGNTAGKIFQVTEAISVLTLVE